MNEIPDIVKELRILEINYKTPDIVNELNQTLQKKGFVEQPLSQLENRYLAENVILKKTSMLDIQINRYEEYVNVNFALEIQKNSKSKQKKHEELVRKERINVSKRRSNWQKD